MKINNIPQIVYEISVEYAVPTAPNLGVRIILRMTLIMKQSKKINIALYVFPLAATNGYITL